MIGQKLGPYEVVASIGAGGMGEVYAGRDTRLDRPVAIKVVSEVFARRFEREGRTLAAINHPNICTLYDLGPNYLVMELVPGETLRQLLLSGPLPIPDAVRYGVQIADALAAAHAHGIVHRDLKPGNIMVGGGSVKVLDFGIATSRSVVDPQAATVTSGTPPVITAQGQTLGTPHYMAPEQAEGKPVDARADVFAFGIVLYEMVCGQRPFRGDTTLAMLANILQATPEPPRHLRRDLPKLLEQLILRCLEKNPDARFDSGWELREAFRGLEQRTTASSVRALRIDTDCDARRDRRRHSRVRLAFVSDRLTRGMGRAHRRARNRAADSGGPHARSAPAVPGGGTDRPGSRALFKLAEGIAPHDVRFESDPSGAQIYATDYAGPAGEDLTQWQLLGVTPVTFGDAPRWGFFRIRAVKAGFTTTEQTLGEEQNVRITLHPAGAVPAGMVYAPAARRHIDTAVGVAARVLDRSPRGNERPVQKVRRRGRLSETRVLDASVRERREDALVARGDGGVS